MQKSLLLLLYTLFSCSNPTMGQTKIDAAQTEALLKNDPALLLIDLRTSGELTQTGCIEGARQIDFNSPDFQAQLDKLEKGKPVIVYCAAGGRSAKAAEIMRTMGFTNVSNYAGGMNDWMAKGKKTVK